MIIAPRFIAGENREITTVPSGRLKLTPKHTIQTLASFFFTGTDVDGKAEIAIPILFIRPDGTSVFIQATGDKSPVYYQISLWDFLRNPPFLKLALMPTRGEGEIIEVKNKFPPPRWIGGWG
jgi:hypothetical protein